MARVNAICCGCKQDFEAINMVQSYLANRGGRVSYVCRNCMEFKPYSSINNVIVGTGKKGFTFTWETEYSQVDENAMCQFLEYQWIPCKNGKVGENGVIMKSPKHTSLKSIHKQLITIDKLHEKNSIQYIDECTMMFTIEHELIKDLQKKEWLEVLKDTLQDIEENEEKRINLFGNVFKIDYRNVEKGKLKFVFSYRNHDEFMNCVNWSYDTISKVLACKVENEEDTEKVSKKVKKIYDKYTRD